MSIIPLAIYILAVSGFSNYNIANGLPVPAFSTSNETKPSNGAPQPLFQALDADLLSKLQGGSLPGVKKGNGHGDNFHTRPKPTTPNSLGFDFKYLFAGEPKNDSKKQKWDKLKFKNLNQDNRQNNLNSANNEIFNENENAFEFNEQGFGDGNVGQFDPFLNLFMPAPNFLNFRRPNYAGNRGPIPMWTPRSYSNGFGFPMPQFFPPGLGRF